MLYAVYSTLQEVHSTFEGRNSRMVDGVAAGEQRNASGASKLKVLRASITFQTYLTGVISKY